MKRFVNFINPFLNCYTIQETLTDKAPCVLVSVEMNPKENAVSMR